MTAKAKPKDAQKWVRPQFRLGRLVAAVEDATERNGGDVGAAVRSSVLALAKSPDVKAYAATLGVDRSMLSRCLRGKVPNRAIRRRLEAELGLPDGGMDWVLALTEADDDRR